MDRRERIADMQESLIAALEGWQAGIWTALPGIVQSFDPAKMTVAVKPALKAFISGTDGVGTWVEMPLLVDCPVMFPGGGGFTLTFPVAAGDECLMVFANRCIDAWWDSSSVSVQSEMRMHDLSDGFAFVGVRSRPRALSSVSTVNVQLRSDDGSAYVEIQPDHDIHASTTANVLVDCAAATVNASGVVTLNAAQVVVNASTVINGHLQVNGAIDATGDVSGNGTSLHTHTHPVSNIQGGVSTVTSGAPL
jgi:phage baseplate assembly protein gpV